MKSLLLARALACTLIGIAQQSHADGITHLDPNPGNYDWQAQANFQQCLKTRKDSAGRVDAFGCDQIYKAQTRTPTYSCMNGTCWQD